MARLLITLGILLTVSACSPSQPDQPAASTQPKGPAQVAMAVHITRVHGVNIGSNDAAEILVAETNGLVRVTFTPAALKRIDPTCLTVMNFDGSTKTFSKREFLAFLDQLHAFFMVTTVQPKRE